MSLDGKIKDPDYDFSGSEITFKMIDRSSETKASTSLQQNARNMINVSVQQQFLPLSRLEYERGLIISISANLS